jgi:Fe-S-cluster containining protein
MFEKIYEIYEKEIAAIAFVCRAGCAACCTQSVTMTTAEGRAILAFLAARGRRLPVMPDSAARIPPGITTNGLAACCLTGREPPAEPEAPWIFEPCVFLAGERCTIYPVRPFGCRSFGSTQSCGEQGSAVAPAWFITLNTVVNQLLEHLDRGGGWGNMYEVLAYLTRPDPAGARAGGCRAARLLPTQALPGLLIPPGEEAVIGRFWAQVVRAGIVAGGS